MSLPSLSLVSSDSVINRNNSTAWLLGFSINWSDTTKQYLKDKLLGKCAKSRIVSFNEVIWISFWTIPFKFEKQTSLSSPLLLVCLKRRILSLFRYRLPIKVVAHWSINSKALIRSLARIRSTSFAVSIHISRSLTRAVKCNCTLL